MLRLLTMRMHACQLRGDETRQVPALRFDLLNFSLLTDQYTNWRGVLRHQSYTSTASAIIMARRPMESHIKHPNLMKDLRQYFDALAIGSGMMLVAICSHDFTYTWLTVSKEGLQHSTLKANRSHCS
jgi:hypothetical protein